MVGYVDDLLILVRGIKTLKGLIAKSIDIVELSCEYSGLSVNAGKTELITFTRDYKIPETRPLVMYRVNIKELKYLQVTLDSKLLWNKHIE